MSVVFFYSFSIEHLFIFINTVRINNQFKFAVDLGTSNTHIEVSNNGRESEAYGYLKSPVSKFFIQTFDDHGGPKNLQIENNIMEKDLLPALVGNGSDFHFPTRTILSCAKSTDWNSNLNCFEMHNIPLTYGKRVELSYNDYHYDIKWGTEEKDKAILRCYIDDMMFMLRSKVVVEGGDEMDIANGILKKKPAGIQAYGNTVKKIEDDDGNQFNIGFTRPTKVNIDLVINFVSNSLQTDEWKANLKNELIKAFNSLYTVGDSVYAYNLYYVLNNHSEIKNVTNFKVKKHSESSYADSVAIGKRELALLAEDNITINQSV